MRFMRAILAAAVIFSGVTLLARPQQPPPPALPAPPSALSPAQTAAGQAVFDKACASCHAAPAADSKIPPRDVLRQFRPEAIVNALVNGKMQAQGAALTDAERRAVAEFLAGRVMIPVSTVANKCTANPRMTDPSGGASWNGWGNGMTNARFQPADRGRLTANDLPKLKLKWAFGYANVAAARAQPTVAGGRLFIASENGEVHALDPKTGCSYWTFGAQAGVRTALVVGPYKTRAGASGYAVYFGDATANAYAVDAMTGQQIWVREVDQHKFAAITGAPAVYNGRVYVPVQGLNEEGQGGRGGYQCCTFRGSLVALDANTGDQIWKRYTLPEEPKPRAKNKDGVQMWGPAGGGIWSSPTIDPKRRMVYVATGNNYADPPQPTSDAVMAMDLDSGAVKWVKQVTPNDNWTLGCQPTNPDNPACPATMGPDFDFSASPALASINGKDLLVLPQKSGLAYALDPDNEGNIVWQHRIGKGSGLGGQWGAAVDASAGIAYTGVADFLTPTPGGMRALRLTTGEEVWTMPPPAKLCGEGRGCSAAQGGAVTAIPGAVLSGSLDGGLRAYSAKDGSIIWLFDTNKDFPTVNGVKANGGGMDGPGPVVAGGMLFVNSGYGGLVGRPGNVLLAFGLD